MKQRTVSHEKFTFAFGRHVGRLGFILQHGGKKTKYISRQLKVMISILSKPQTELYKIVSSHIPQCFSKCYCARRRFRNFDWSSDHSQ